MNALLGFVFANIVESSHAEEEWVVSSKSNVGMYMFSSVHSSVHEGEICILLIVWQNKSQEQSSSHSWLVSMTCSRKRQSQALNNYFVFPTAWK